MRLTDYIEKHEKTHIIFDFDATLFLLMLPWIEWKEIFKKELQPLHGHIWDAYENKEITLAQAQNKYIDIGGLETLNKFNRTFEISRLQGLKHNSDLLLQLSDLPEDLHLFIWSSNSTDTLEGILKETKLRSRFEKVISREDVPYIKPNPAGFKLIHDTSVDISNYLMVGDSEADRDAAKSAGIDFYHIDYFL